MDDQNKNLILATALSFLVILGWFMLFPPPEPDPAAQQTAAEQTDSSQPMATAPAASAPVSGSAPDAAAANRAAALADAPRVPIETARLTGSISLQGGRIDDLSLKDYNETIEDGSDIVTVLSPVGSPEAYYALYGWAPGAGMSLDDVPGANTLWTVEEGASLTTATPISLTWTNPKGVVFRRTISVDEDFMFSVSQSVENTSGETISLAPYGIVARHGVPSDQMNFFILHEGLVGMTDGQLMEIDYDEITEFSLDPAQGVPAEVTAVQNNGWIGFTDHYWMAALVPEPGTSFRAVAKYNPRTDIYQAETVLPTQQVAAGQSATTSIQFFAGAKEWEAIRTYEQSGIEGFLDSIDWGWFFFLTKPIFFVLHWLHGIIGNMGWAIIALTLFLKALLFPLAYKSYVSMAKMKELQPQMEALKERAGDDRQKLQQGMMELYKKEKVNPAAGCLPILLQIPIFFSLYKVIFVTIELRHAPWLGPFQDLSAPDPTSIMNLFGLLPLDGPEPGSIMALVFIGILPLLLGISMWLQQKLNPAPTDATQAMIFAWMPWVFMFMLGGFASGLVIYWIANNTITFTQQYLIMRSQGYKPDVFGNIKSSFKRGATAPDKKK
jgi:YidC/Oxa1 family membrane protein insertase